ncbi:hypothetical protein BaRGS_00024432 [Batillaria attramentaria]|uniref:Uncharacterized protein n=1 Tax=Batillaria attramentaria TaxID=370345 RepID=A0ABD0KB95_9CAEN
MGPQSRIGATLRTRVSPFIRQSSLHAALPCLPCERLGATGDLRVESHTHKTSRIKIPTDFPPARQSDQQEEDVATIQHRIDIVGRQKASRVGV